MASIRASRQRRDRASGDAAEIIHEVVAHGFGIREDVVVESHVEARVTQLESAECGGKLHDSAYEEQGGKPEPPVSNIFHSQSF